MTAIRRNIIAILLPAMIAMLGACDSNHTGSDDDIIVRAGSHTLTRQQLQKLMPGGMNSADSVAYARSIINEWIDNRIIDDIAAREIDMAQIDRMVNEYRQELIRRSYADTRFAAEHTDTVADDTVAAVYERLKPRLRTQRPMVKGIYLKIPDDADELPLLRRLYRSTSQDDIDRLEREVLKSAVHYDYFRDRWVDWEQIETRIPTVTDANRYDAGLRSGATLETSVGGFTYLLSLTAVLPAGSPMPPEVAAPLIRQQLLTRDRRQFDARLSARLRAESIDDGYLEIFCDM